MWSMDSDGSQLRLGGSDVKRLWEMRSSVRLLRLARLAGTGPDKKLYCTSRERTSGPKA